jgi:hypothetical protein
MASLPLTPRQGSGPAGNLPGRAHADVVRTFLLQPPADVQTIQHVSVVAFLLETYLEALYVLQVESHFKCCFLSRPEMKRRACRSSRRTLGFPGLWTASRFLGVRRVKMASPPANSPFSPVLQEIVPGRARADVVRGWRCWLYVNQGRQLLR